MMTRCAKCGLPIEAEDLVEEDNPEDPLQPFHFHLWCVPEAKENGIEAP
ncbi:MAG TPA: hypothetical protein VNO50_08500 [Pyrinomonadaceae bacterium]|nr:hypothetical protein [Pyrinomonadaceae bacterium]